MEILRIFGYLEKIDYWKKKFGNLKQNVANLEKNLNLEKIWKFGKYLETIWKSGKHLKILKKKFGNLENW